MLEDILILGLATGTAALTLTQSKIFRWLQNGTKRVHPWVGDLFNCSYCMGHWVGAVLTTVYVATLPDSSGPVFWGVIWLAVTGVGALTSGAAGRLFGHESE